MSFLYLDVESGKNEVRGFDTLMRQRGLRAFRRGDACR